MKHVFCVHSSITYLISISVIRELELGDNEVLFFTFRNYKVEHCYKVHNCTEWLNWYHPLCKSSLLYHNKHVKDIDKCINEYCNSEEYVAYIPTTSSAPYQIIISNPFCKGYSIIEEGIANYKDNLYSKPAVERSPFVTSLCFMFNCVAKRIQLNHSFLGPYRKLATKPQYFYFRNPAHKYKPDHHYLDFPSKNISTATTYTDSIIIIMSPLIEYDLCLLDNLKKIYTKMLQDVPMEKKVYAKFHPAQGIIGQNIFVEAIKKKGIKCEIMSNEINIETVIMTSKNIELWGVDSSVLFYAPILNPTAKIKYFNEELAAIDVRYKQYKHHCLSV